MTYLIMTGLLNVDTGSILDIIPNTIPNKLKDSIQDKNVVNIK